MASIPTFDAPFMVMAGWLRDWGLLGRFFRRRPHWKIMELFYQGSGDKDM